MSNDHYVAETYLRKFAGPDGRLTPYYKRSLKIIGTARKPKSLCSASNGDTNTYLPDPRVLNKYLRLFENRWSKNVDQIERRDMSPRLRYQLSGYIGYLRVCNPVATRLVKKLLEEQLRPLAYKVAKEHLQKFAFEDEETRTMVANDLESGLIKPEVDPEFAHAHGISSLIYHSRMMFCSDWAVFLNNSKTPFITSDNPAVLWFPEDNPQFAYTYVPLSPKCALMINPHRRRDADDKSDEWSYHPDQTTFGEVKPSFISQMNDLIIKSAEKVVLHGYKEIWLEKAVESNRDWGVEGGATFLGPYVISQARVRDTNGNWKTRSQVTSQSIVDSE